MNRLVAEVHSLYGPKRKGARVSGQPLQVEIHCIPEQLGVAVVVNLFRVSSTKNVRVC